MTVETVGYSIPKWASKLGYPLFHKQLQKRFKAQTGKSEKMQKAKQHQDWTWESISQAHEAKKNHFENHTGFGTSYKGL